MKARLLNLIKRPELESIDVDEVSADNRCELGCWIHGDANRYAHYPEYRHLKAAYADLHRAVGDVVRLVQAGNPDQARKLMGTVFFTQSNDTISSLQALRQRVESSLANGETN